jgi:hypothetical protein
MSRSNLHETQYERKEMAHGKEMNNEYLETRSEERVEYCNCCGEPMTHIEVLESYLEQRIEQALEACDALSAEYGNAVQFEILGKIAGSLQRAATLTETARLVPEGG